MMMMMVMRTSRMAIMITMIMLVLVMMLMRMMDMMIIMIMLISASDESSLMTLMRMMDLMIIMISGFDDENVFCQRSPSTAPVHPLWPAPHLGSNHHQKYLQSSSTILSSRYLQSLLEIVAIIVNNICNHITQYLQ